MTDQLFQKLEEKMMALLAELESSRKQIQALQQENFQLKNEHSQHSKKLQSLLEVLDTLQVADVALQVQEEASA